MLRVINITSTLHIICITIFILSSALFLFSLVKHIFSNFNKDTLYKINNIILLLAIVSLFTALIDPFILSFKAMDSIASSGTRDIIIISIGFLEFIASYLFYLLLTAVLLLEHVILKFSHMNKH